MQERKYSISLLPDSDWDIVAKHPLQTTMFAKYYENKYASIPLYLRALEDDVVIAQLLCFIEGKGTSFFSNYFFGNLINKFNRFIFPIVVFYSGPDYIKEDLDKKAIMDNIELTIAEHYGISHVKGNMQDLVNHKDKWATQIINLTKDKEELWKNIEHSARKNIKKTETQTIVSFKNDFETLQQYLALLKESRKSLGFNHLPPAYIDESCVCSFGEDAQVCIVKEKGTNEPIAAMGLLIHQDNCIEIGSAISPKCRDKKLYCGDLIKWEIIKYAKSKGVKYYDLGGCSPNPVNDKEKDIRRFKEKFGGEYKEYSILK